MRNPRTWFQLGIIGDAGPEITNGLGAFLLCDAIKARIRPGFFLRQTAPDEHIVCPSRSLGKGFGVVRMF